MAAGTQGPSHHGLVSGHAYGVLDAQELKDASGTVVHKLIKMRNPWGIEEYDGDWGDKSTLWTPEFKKQAGYTDKDDGMFFVPLDQWRTDYAGFYMCHYRKDWNESSFEGTPSVYFETGYESEWVEMDVSEDQTILLELTTMNARLFPADCAGDNAPLDFMMDVFDLQIDIMDTTP